MLGGCQGELPSVLAYKSYHPEVTLLLGRPCNGPRDHQLAVLAASEVQLYMLGCVQAGAGGLAGPVTQQRQEIAGLRSRSVPDCTLLRFAG